jgi:hypothetical protein
MASDQSCDLKPDIYQRQETIALCPDQVDWLAELATRYGFTGAADASSLALRKLVDLANGEGPKVKKQIFLIVRCHRCLQHTRGGDKEDSAVVLPEMQWQWLAGVQERCRHPTVGKTIRILIDFYKPIFEKDDVFERAIFGAISEAAPAAAEGGSGDREKCGNEAAAATELASKENDHTAEMAVPSLPALAEAEKPPPHEGYPSADTERGAATAESTQKAQSGCIGRSSATENPLTACKSEARRPSGEVRPSRQLVRHHSR